MTFLLIPSPKYPLSAIQEMLRPPAESHGRVPMQCCARANTLINYNGSFFFLLFFSSFFFPSSPPPFFF